MYKKAKKARIKSAHSRESRKPIDKEVLLQTKYDSLLSTFPGYKRRELLHMKDQLLKKRKGKEKPKSISQMIAEDRELRANKGDSSLLKKKYEALLRQFESVESERDTLLGLSRRRVQSYKITPKSDRGQSEATAFFVASDWHIEEEVRPGTVNGVNEFNLDIADARIDLFFKNSLKLLQMAQKDVVIKDIVFAALGDFISNTIHDELMEGNLLLPADAIWKAQTALISGLRFLLDNTDCHITVVCHSGNHGRMTKKQRIATESGNSLEAFMYNNMALYFEDEPRLTFTISEGYHTYLDVYETTVRLHHGHSIYYQGGVGGIYVSVNKAINQWNKTRRADLDVFGHFHQFVIGSNFICNGSLIGFNAYAINIKAGYERPQQAFFLIDKNRGRTVIAPILLEDY